MIFCCPTIQPGALTRALLLVTRGSLFWIVAVGPEKMAILGFCARAGNVAPNRKRIIIERSGEAMNDIYVPPIKSVMKVHPTR